MMPPLFSTTAAHRFGFRRGIFLVVGSSQTPQAMAAAIDPRVLVLEKELARVRGEFERALAAVPAEKLHKAPKEGAWTPAQLLWHLAKIERGVARLLERLDAGLGPMDTVPPGPRCRHPPCRSQKNPRSCAR